ncbi:hypothetical protein H696_03002 [Fonticula alba]|uniref:DNA polymerase II subunit 2 n=1 Tax=Fonticula alba TaxID=691883 RepID=A0A058ZB43_FONAL|nr:hypothetical protein H696_03002 [Fonticula alba]KCV70647.1 hypothetical protein H696_03002 [Fonticula alba]|eukprot:XP_009495163.1 hypothetical protein H696_03002 [Fonticula alba]
MSLSSTGIPIAAYRRAIYSAFTRSHGLTLSQEAFDYLVSVLQAIPVDPARPARGNKLPIDQETALLTLARSYTKHASESGSSLISRPALELVVQQLTKLASAAGEAAKSTMSSAAIPAASGADLQTIAAETPAAVAPTTQTPTIDAPTFTIQLDTVALLRVLGAEQQPRLLLDRARNVWNVAPRASPFSKHADGHNAAILERYHLLHARCARHALFRPEHRHAGGMELATTDSLSGRPAEAPPVCLFGLLSRGPDGRPRLEDPYGSIRLDLSSAVANVGLFSAGTFALLEGQLASGSDMTDAMSEGATFRVSHVGFPPSESRAATLSRSLGFTSSTGMDHRSVSGIGDVSGETQWEDAHIEQAAADPRAAWVVLSDVKLDSPVVMRMLERLFGSYQTAAEDWLSAHPGQSLAGLLPDAFLMFGDFTQHGASSDLHHCRTLWAELGALIVRFPLVANRCRFIFVPGPNDHPASGSGGLTGILPAEPIPPEWLEGTLFQWCHPVDAAAISAADRPKNAIRYAHFTSNPCRLLFGPKEFCFFRHDLLGRMRRSLVVPPNLATVSDIRTHLAHTIIENAHLAPHPAPPALLWEYDHVLRLYPLPDAVFLADQLPTHIDEIVHEAESAELSRRRNGADGTTAGGLRMDVDDGAGGVLDPATAASSQVADAEATVSRVVHVPQFSLNGSFIIFYPGTAKTEICKITL